MAKITYIEDIAAELAEEFGLGEEEALEICKLNVEFIYDKMRDPEVISIRLPLLGTLHFNARRAKYSYKHSRTFEHWRPVIEKQIALASENYDKNGADVVHWRKSFMTQFKKFFFPDMKTRKKTRKKEVYRKLEIRQNKK